MIVPSKSKNAAVRCASRHRDQAGRVAPATTRRHTSPKAASAASATCTPCSCTKCPASGSSSGGGQPRIDLRERLHHRRAEHRILHADRHERRPAPALAEEPGGLLRDRDAFHFRARPARAPGSDARRPGNAGPGTVRRRRRPRPSVSPGDRTLHQGRRCAKSGLRGHEGLPGVEAGPRRAPDAEPGVHDDQPVDALGILHRQREPEQPAPVLHDQRHALQVERLDEAHQHPAVEAERVDRVVHRLVGAAEPEEVRRHDAVPGRQEHAGSSCGTGSTRSAGRAGTARCGRWPVPAGRSSR